MVTESAGWGPVVEQLALHGPVKDNQAVVATTSYPLQVASVVDKNHSNLSSPSKPIHLVLGQRRPSGKSREAGRPGNSEERQPMQAALVDNNPHGDPILAERYRTAFGKNMKASSQNSTFTFLQCTIVNSILVTVPYSRSIFSVNFIIFSDVTIYCVPSH